MPNFLLIWIQICPILAVRLTDAKKHLLDIVRLITLLDDEDRVRNILKSDNLGNISKDTIVELLKSVYKID